MNLKSAFFYVSLIGFCLAIPLNIPALETMEAAESSDNRVPGQRIYGSTRFPEEFSTAGEACRHLGIVSGQGYEYVGSQQLENGSVRCALKKGDAEWEQDDLIFGKFVCPENAAMVKGDTSDRFLSLQCECSPLYMAAGGECKNKGNLNKDQKKEADTSAADPCADVPAFDYVVKGFQEFHMNDKPYADQSADIAHLKLLACNLHRIGEGKPASNYEAHHIVAWDAVEAEPARQILLSASIDIDSALNGVWLLSAFQILSTPQGTVQEALTDHAIYQTKAYFDYVNEQLRLSGPEGAVDALDAIKAQLATEKSKKVPALIRN